MVQKMLGEQYFNDIFATVNSTKRIINTKTKSILTPRNWKKKNMRIDRYRSYTNYIILCNKVNTTNSITL